MMITSYQRKDMVLFTNLSITATQEVETYLDDEREELSLL